MSAIFDFPRFMLISNRRLAALPLAAVIDEACSAGAKLIHLREKDLTGKPLYELALSIQEITRRCNAHLIVNSRLDIALAANADALHLPETALPVQSVRPFFKKKVGRSVHSVQGAIAAETAGADYLIFGHVFETSSKLFPPRGLKELNRVCKAVNIPVYAIGGVTPENAALCLNSGAFGIAAMNGVMNSGIVANTVAHYLRGL
jgi:thiamine-phosphate pyrophosphorylase